jgi:cytochrome c
MNRSHQRMVAASVAGAIALAWTLNWFTQQIMPEDNPGTLAYKPVDDMPPRVDLGAVQRDWPGSLGEPGDLPRLAAYRREIEGKVPPPAAAAQVAATPAVALDLGTLLASADAGAGKDKARVCASCHDFADGGPNRIGPNLWGVAGRDVASHPGFAYSPAMSNQPGNWTYQFLFDYLASPARALPGTKMSFAGLRRPEDRAAVIKYLATLGSAPPMPAPKVAAASEQAAR